ARQPNAGVAWYLTDHLGSVRDLENGSNQAVGDHLDYDGFGDVTDTVSSYGDRYKYTAREWDGNTGLQYNRARYYDSRIGRWINQDPMGFGAGDDNLYRYVGNDPLNSTDPTALSGVRPGGPGNKPTGLPKPIAPGMRPPEPEPWITGEQAVGLILFPLGS